MTQARFSSAEGADPARRRELAGYALGFLGVVIFGGTIPFTKLAIHDLSPWFLALGRASVAACLATATLLVTRSPRPRREDIVPLLASGVLLVLGFPLFITMALEYVPAIHGAIVIGILPLATVVAAAIILRERPSPAFWFWAALGALAVVGYAVRKGGFTPHLHDMLLLAAVACASTGYTIAGRLSRHMRGWQVISWQLVFLFPVTLPVALFNAPADLSSVPLSAWTGFGYVSLFSMFLGFFAWNAGLAMGGVSRVSQVQLLQTFVSLAVAALLLGEPLDAETLLFASAVVVIVFLGRRARVGVTPPPPPCPPKRTGLSVGGNTP
ncbi:DMT family transporter [Tepidamorphus sp. 3E244]|uniref:DMT family transporter n=1 Tax=Tepidamorphus sp. 3E244 TaxID=3385498 RepID=UPI0038FCE304